VSLDLLRQRAVPFAIGLNRPFRGVTQRIGLLIPGPSGWGEFAPFTDYSDEAAGRWLNAALEAAYGSWPAPQRHVVESNAIIPAVSPPQAQQLAQHAIDVLGCTTIKCKVGDGQDAARLAAVRSVLPPSGRIRLDVNAGWSVDDTVDFWQRYGGADIDYLEQPVRTFDELIALRPQIDARIALDESIRWDPTAAGVDLAAVADVAIIKVAPLGGVHAAMEVAERIGLPVVVSGAMDSSVGLSAAVACAAALAELDGPCGFGTGTLLADDLVAAPLMPRDGVVPVGRIEPNMAQLAAARARISAPDLAHLMDQLTRAWWSGPAEIWSEHIRQDA
jgi:o-succinylbenzoate synthase